MTSRIAKTWTVGCCAFALVAFTDAAKAQGAAQGVGPKPGATGPGAPEPYPVGPGVAGPGNFGPIFAPLPGFRQLPACSFVGQIVTLHVSTGSESPLGTADPIWTVAAAAAYSTSSKTSFGNWFSSAFAAVNWIQPAAGGTPQNFAQGTYVYRTRFATPVHPYFYDSIRIKGYFGADDTAIVKLNGNPIAECNSPCFNNSPRLISGVRASNWRNFAQATTGWPIPYYLNTLTVEVTNTPQFPTPSGLFVGATVTAVCSKCTSPVPPVPPDPPSCSGIFC